jgi:hypothetical protein
MTIVGGTGKWHDEVEDRKEGLVSATIGMIEKQLFPTLPKMRSATV